MHYTTCIATLESKCDTPDLNGISFLEPASIKTWGNVQKINIRCNCTCTNFLLSYYHLRSPPIVQNWPYAFCDATFSPLSKVVMRVGYCCGDTLEAFAGHCASFRAAGGWVRGSVGYERHLANGTRNLSMGFLNIKLITCSHVTKHSREYERPVYKKGCTYSIWIGRASKYVIYKTSTERCDILEIVRLQSHGKEIAFIKLEMLKIRVRL